MRIKLLALTLGFGQMLSACATSVPSDPPIKPPPAVARPGPDSWVLMIPPMEGYSSDRTPQMGGPLALPADWTSRTGAGKIFVDIDRLDTHAPLSKWRKGSAFVLQRDCEDYRALKIKELSDPKATTKFTFGQRDRIFDPIFFRDLLNASRCVSADQLGSTR
jgi:hypothetical protein